MERIELLAPAGSIESLYAAVQAGADAVYLGGSKFSARAYASNFDDENMIKAVQYCHLYNVKVYITINTILKEKELYEALQYAKFLYEIGVDALIIQDVGFASLVKKHLPKFELHASTQMTIHNAEGALFLRNLGFRRIVLSRELSIAEIGYISNDLGVETEIFVHGALCVCYSGQCLMSSMIGGRSGNRGRCAQPCRLPYTIIDKDNMSEKKGYILSPKDICTIENIKEIIGSGTTSLKIEGRMKRPEYVAGVVSAYRKAIDSILGKKYAQDFERVEHLDKEKRKLLQLFNREGFSKAYLFGNLGKDMMAYSFPKNTGVLLGKVQKDLSILLQENISISDGVRAGEKGFTVSKIIQKDKEVVEALEGSIVKIKPVEFKAGDLLYKTLDVNLMKSISGIYKSPFERKIGLLLGVEFEVGKPIKLSTVYKDKEYSISGDIIQKALKKPVDRNNLTELLSKSGDTPFKFEDIDILKFEEGFMPVSAINEARRMLIGNVEKDILKIERQSDEANVDYDLKANTTYDTVARYMYCVNNRSQIKALKECDFNNIAVDIFYRKSDITDDYIKANKNLWIKVPNIIKEEFEVICSQIERLIPYIKGIVTSNLGIVHRFMGKLPIIGDYKLNIFNVEALTFYNRFFNTNCLSVELNRSEISEIVRKSEGSSQLLIYGKIENMVSEYCVVGSTFGDKSSKKSCNRSCEKGSMYLKDRMGAELTVQTDKFCRCHIYNSVPLNLIDNISELKKIGIKHYRIDFIDEEYEDVKKIAKAIAAEKWEENFSEFTRGHYKRGVE